MTRRVLDALQQRGNEFWLSPVIAATARVFKLILVTADTRLLGVDDLATLANR